MTGRNDLCALLVAIAAILTVACEPEIGDSCVTAADCTSSTDRICDATQPGGYCTLFNCEPDGCPEEAACVAFRTFEGEAAACRDDQGGSRLQRTFCMRRCSTDSDCRSGYACLNIDEIDSQSNPWAAQVIDKRSSAICAVPFSGMLPQDMRETDVCTAGPAGAGTGAATDAATPAGGDAGGTTPGDGG